MATGLIHRAISHDGTQITGHVSGKGPPLVFVHGALDDGKLDWGAVPPLLADRFACYVMSTRNRGLSGENRDLSRQRLVEDVTAFADRVGEPVGLVGTSGGGMLALGAAANAAAVSAVAVYEPVVLDVVDQDTLAGLRATLEGMRQAAAEGRAADAARMFLAPILNDDEMAAISGSSFFDAAARYVHVDVEEIRQATESQGRGPTDPSELGRINVPVLLMYGSKTAMRWFVDGVDHVAEHVRDARVREVAGAGHLGPSLQPEPVATELSQFFQAALQPGATR